MSVSKTGKIYLVGIGPGDEKFLTPGAVSALQQCDTVIGYRLYIQQVEYLLSGKEQIAMDLGQEMERASRAVELASAGRIVGVISSGDAGIYGMSGPVFLALSEVGWDGQSPRVETVPGVSAMQAAAALLGAPLMQDFCAISLSNLLTPWEAIERRLQAAAQGDFVVALYNPRSRRRDWQLLEARRIMMEHRPGTTPVGIVREAYRPGQKVTITDLEHLEEQAGSVDMVTTVLIGNSTTYTHAGLMATPRGYEEKRRSNGPSQGP